MEYVTAWLGLGFTILSALTGTVWWAAMRLGTLTAKMDSAGKKIAEIHETMNGGSRCQRHSDELRYTQKSVHYLERRMEQFHPIEPSPSPDVAKSSDPQDAG